MRELLGDLWLTWYVHRSDPRRPYERIWETVEDAQQLRVRDVAEDQRVWEAMSHPDRSAPELSHAKSIEEYERRYAAFESVVLILPAWKVPEGHVLVDGMHRACALYRLNPSRLHLSVLEFEPPFDSPDTQPGPRAEPL